MIESLLSEDVLQTLNAYSRLYVGLSGGLDSTVLLHALHQVPILQPKLTAIHIHHGLSSNADAWQAHCVSFCSDRAIPIMVRAIQLTDRANLEEQAREGRYAVFAEIVNASEAILLAHHADDQAETVLLRLFRGSGVDGLAAMPMMRSIGHGVLYRPLLYKKRDILLQYAQKKQLSWVEDESNQCLDYTRNYIRQHLMPQLLSRWPKLIETLLTTADHCRMATDHLAVLAAIDAPSLTDRTLCLTAFLTAHPERLSHVIRVWLKNNQVKLPSTQILQHILTDLVYARVDASPVIRWGEVELRRYQQTLYLRDHSFPQSYAPVSWSHFPTAMAWGSVFLQPKCVREGIDIPPNARIEVRVRLGGERMFWRGHMRSLKKLLQQWGIPPWERAQLPLVYINDELAVIPGVAVDERFVRVGDASYYQIDVVKG